MIFSFVVRNAVARGKRVCVLAHRQEIVEQIDVALSALDVPHGLIAAGHPETDAPVQVASVMTLARRLPRYSGRFDLLVRTSATTRLRPSGEPSLMRCRRLSFLA